MGTAESQVKLAALQGAECQRQVSPGADLDADLGRGRHQLREPLQRRVWLAPGINTDRTADLARGRNGSIGRGQRLCGIRQEPLTCVGQSHAARRALEQHLANLVLESLYPLGEGLLGQVQLRCRPAEVPVLGHCRERPHLRQVEIHGPTICQQPAQVKSDSA